MTSPRHKGLESATSPATPAAGPDDSYLDAAREAILAVGWSRTTLTDIARRAGVSRMTLYRRWPDMQTMLADLMTREWGRVAGAAITPADSPADSPADHPAGGTLHRISEGVVATVRGLRANELLRRIIDVDPELLLPYLLDRRGRSQELVAVALADLIRAGQADGSIRAGDPDRLARSVLLACHGFTLSAHTMADVPGTGGQPGAAPSRDADVSAFDTELGNLVERYLQP
jgi:AcrR family transcriptional regulator